MIVPGPLWTQTTEQNREAATALFEDVCRALTTPLSLEKEATEKIPKQELITVTGEDYTEATENMYALFMEKHWGDGLPMVPPTGKTVQQMLQGTSHSPNELVGIVEPRRGVATVRVAGH